LVSSGSGSGSGVGWATAVGSGEAVAKGIMVGSGAAVGSGDDSIMGGGGAAVGGTAVGGTAVETTIASINAGVVWQAVSKRAKNRINNKGRGAYARPTAVNRIIKIKHPSFSQTIYSKPPRF
jgi:hypothetical protein